MANIDTIRKTKIQWTQFTYNPATGCHKISDGCRYCYMMRDKERYKQDSNIVKRTGAVTFNAPVRWHKLFTGNEPFTERLVFLASYTDFFIEEIDAFRDEIWRIIKATPNLIYQILTKRPENIANRLPADWGDGYKNVWLGVSVENQPNLERIKILSQINAKVRFVSFEPLLSAIQAPPIVFQSFDMPPPMTGDGITVYQKIHWAILGGESGNDTGYYRYRPSELVWYSDLVEQLRAAGVAPFVKQLGTDLAKRLNLSDRHGGNIDEFPENLRVREFPKFE